MHVNSGLKTGEGAFEARQHSIVHLTTEYPSQVFWIDENGEEVYLLHTTPQKPQKIRVKDNDTIITVKPPVQDGHWGFDVFETRPALDPTPVEIPEDGEFPETLEDKMVRIVRHMIMERYGQGEAVETIEEAMDFDINDDGQIGPYEVMPMQETEPVQDVEQPQEQAEPVPPQPEIAQEPPAAPASQ